jgi:hypothetical protein
MKWIMIVQNMEIVMVMENVYKIYVYVKLDGWEMIVNKKDV